MELFDMQSYQQKMYDINRVILKILNNEAFFDKSHNIYTWLARR